MPGLPLTSRILSSTRARIASTKPGVGLLDVADLLLAGLLLQLLDHPDDLDDRLVAELDRVGDVVLVHLAAADLDHVDEVLGAGDDEVQVAVLELLDGRVEDELAVDPADADVGGRADERDVADGDGGRGGDAGEMSGSFSPSNGQDVQVDLHLVHEPLGEQRPQRAVDQAGGEDLLGGRPALALHEPAGELAGGGAALAVVDLEREEVDPLARVGADDGADDDRVAVLHGHRRRRPAWRSVPVSIESVRPPIWRSTRMACIRS